MKLIHYAILIIILSLFIGVYRANAQLFIFDSDQVGASATDGYVLQTDGTDSTWVATTTLGFSAATDILWQLFNGSGLTPKSNIDTVCIADGGCSATSTPSTLEVQGESSVVHTSTGSNMLFDFFDFFELGLYLIPRITGTESTLGSVLIHDYIPIITEPSANNGGLCSGGTNPCLVFGDDSLGNSVYFENDYNNTTFDFAGASLYEFDSAVKPNAIRDSTDSAGSAEQILTAGVGGGSVLWVDKSSVGSKWSITGTVLHPATSNSYSSLSVNKTSGTANFSVDTRYGGYNTASTTHSFGISGSRFLDRCGNGDTFSVCAGTSAGNTTMTGINNTILGGSAVTSLTSGSNLVMVGNGAGSGLTYNSNTIGIGREAMFQGKWENSVAIGHNALYGGNSSASSTGITAVGFEAGYNATNTPESTYIGYQAGKGAFAWGDLGATTSVNTAVGALAFGEAQADSTGNTMVGYGSGFKVTGDFNTFTGHLSGYNIFSGSRNTAMGYEALQASGASSGDSNVAIGYQALKSCTTCSQNVALGKASGDSVTTGAGNTLYGFDSGENITTGSYNLIFGYDVDAPSATASNQLSIGNLIFGTGIDGTGTTLSSGNIGIATSTPLGKFTVAIHDNNSMAFQLDDSNANTGVTGWGGSDTVNTYGFMHNQSYGAAGGLWINGASSGAASSPALVLNGVYGSNPADTDPAVIITGSLATGVLDDGDILMSVQNDWGGTGLFDILANGFVGIGTSTPASTLDVFGTRGANSETHTNGTTAIGAVQYVYCDASSGIATSTLPTVASAINRVYYYKKIDSSANKCILDGNGSETIDGSLTAEITTQYNGIEVHEYNGQWFIH